MSTIKAICKTYKQRVPKKMKLTDVVCDGCYMELIYDQVHCPSFAFLLFVQQSYLTIIALWISLDSVREVVYSYALFLNVNKLDLV